VVVVVVVVVVETFVAEMLEKKNTEIGDLNHEVKELRKENIELKQEVKELRKENIELKQEVKELKKENKGHKHDIDEIKASVKKLEGKDKTRRARLIMGSVVYSLLDRVISQIFGPSEARSLRHKLVSLADVKQKAEQDGKQDSWTTLVSKQKYSFLANIDDIDSLAEDVKKFVSQMHIPLE